VGENIALDHHPADDSFIGYGYMMRIDCTWANAKKDKPRTSKLFLKPIEGQGELFFVFRDELGFLTGDETLSEVSVSPMGRQRLTVSVARNS
jgi:hypothetical protein